MVLAGVVLLAFAPLNVPPGLRTFPEIAALIAEAPDAVRCDPKIAHRAAFIGAKSISREGLMRALGLTLAPDGKRRLMKDADGKIELEWAMAVGESLARRSARTNQAALVAAEAGTPSPGQEWYRITNVLLSDPKATPSERRRADQAWFDAYGTFRVADEEFKDAIGMERALAAFAPELPLELMERGRSFDARPLADLPSETLTTLRRIYPDLKGGPDALVVRRRSLGGPGNFVLSVQLAVADPGQIVPASWGMSVVAYPTSPELSSTGALVRADAERTLPLRTYRTAVAAIRATEAPGRALVDAYAREIPPANVPGATSLSQVVEAWAGKGHDVIQELDPSSEDLSSAFEGPRLREAGDWSPQSVEGVLVLRPLLRFMSARRQWPFAALMALEGTGERAKIYGNARTPTPSSAGLRLYARVAPKDQRWGHVTYRGWYGDTLDRSARAARILALIPAAVRAKADRVLRSKQEGRPIPTDLEAERGEGAVAARWRVPLAGLPPSAQTTIADEMREDDDYNGNVAATSPSLLAAILSEGRMEVEVRDSPTGYGLFCLVRADLGSLGVTGPRIAIQGY